MTILESHVLGVVQAIAAEKAGRNDYPTHTLIIKDNLCRRVEQVMGMEVLPFEVTGALRALERAGHIRMGDTINDTYITTID